MAVVGLLAGIPAGLVVAEIASADDPAPPPGMHQACQRISEHTMSNMHQGMMHADGQMGQWMASDDDCPHD